MPGPSEAHRTAGFASLGDNMQNAGLSIGMGGRRDVRTLPFSKQTFRFITRNFYVRSSIARVISRADVPVFSSASIQVEELDGKTYPAYGSFVRRQLALPL